MQEQPEVLDISLEQATAAQAAFLFDEEHKCPAFVGGFGSGKTHAGIAKALDLSVVNQGRKGLLVEPTYRHIADIMWPKLFDEFLDERGIPYEFNKTDKTVRLPWGSLLMFRTGEKRIVGFDCAWSYVDEAAMCRKNVWTDVGRRTRSPAALRQMFTTFTPEVFAWTHELWGRKDLYDESPPEGYAVYHGSTYDNIFVDEAYLDTLAAGCDPDEAIAVIGGRFTNIKRGRVYYTFDRAKHVKHEAAYDPTLPLDIALDFNATPGMHAELIQRKGCAWAVVDEVYGKGMTLERCCEEIIDRYAARQQAHVTVFGDATGRTHISQRSHYDIALDILRAGILNRPGFRVGVGMEVPTVNPSVADSCASVRAMLEDSRGLIRLIINPNCRRLIADLHGVMYSSAVADQSGRKYAGKPEDIFKGDVTKTHASDALRYWVWQIRPLRDEFQRQTDYRLAAGRN